MSAPQRLDPSFDGVWEELNWRGLVHVSTDAAELKTLLDGAPITFYCGFDPDRAEPAPRQPRPAAHDAAPAARRPPPARPGGRIDRAHRRPAAERRARAQREGHRRRVGRVPAGAGLEVPARRRRQPDALGEQPRLDRAAVSDRLPARHRQALPRRHHAQEGCGQRAPEQRRRHLLRRVQLPDPAGPRLPAALPRLRLCAADRRQRPMGQPHQRRRPHPPGGGRRGARDRHAAHHEHRRHQVRQERGQRDLAGSGDVQPVRVLPVLAQQRGCRRRHPAEGLHVPDPRRDRGARVRRAGCAGQAGGAAPPRVRGHHHGAWTGGHGGRDRRVGGPLRRRRPGRAGRERPWPP